METVKVIGTDFIRDLSTKALINTNDKELSDYYEKVRAMKMQKEEINNIKIEVQEIKNDVSDIKSILLLISQKFDK